MTENPNDNPISTFKLIDKDHPELFWTVETTKVSSERFYFDYNFEDIIKGWFSIVPKYIYTIQENKRKPEK